MLLGTCEEGQNLVERDRQEDARSIESQREGSDEKGERGRWNEKAGVDHD